MGSGMTGDSEVLFFLTNNFMQKSGGQTHRAEAADGEVGAVGNETRHRVSDGGKLVNQGMRLVGEKLASAVTGWISE